MMSLIGIAAYNESIKLRGPSNKAEIIPSLLAVRDAITSWFNVIEYLSQRYIFTNYRNHNPAFCFPECDIPNQITHITEFVLKKTTQRVTHEEQ